MYGVNRTMFPGLATGLDTNQIIKDLMRAERMPLERLNQKRQILEWQRDDYREINTMLASFQSKVSGLYLQSHFNKKTVLSTNDAVISSSVVGTPSQAMYSVEVKELAKAGEHASATFRFQVGDPLLKLSEADDWSGPFQFTVSGSGNEAAVIEVDGEDTVMSVIDKINRATVKTDVKAELVGNQIVMKSTAADSSGKLSLQLSENDAEQAKVLGLEAIQEASGRDPVKAQIVINGVTLVSDTNRFTYDGLQLDVKQLTTGETVNLSIGQDTEAIYDKIVDFVEAYNEMIEKVHEKLGEKRYRDYPPLTDEQREQLSDREIEKWEERAKSGLIKNDPFVRELMTGLRMDLYNTIDGVGHLSDIGITVGKADPGYTRYLENGKLYIDENKLRKAISEDPDLVKNLFTQSATSSDDAARYKETGIGKRLNDSLFKATLQLTKKAGNAISPSEVDGSVMGKQLSDMDKRIVDMERRLLQVEDRYWRQFTALEKAMERLNQQNEWLLGQLGNMN